MWVDDDCLKQPSLPAAQFLDLTALPRGRPNSTSPDSNHQTSRCHRTHSTDNPTLFHPRVLRRRFRPGMEGWLWRAGGWHLAGSDNGRSVDLERGPSAKLVRPRQCRRRHQGARAREWRPRVLWGRRWRGLVVRALDPEKKQGAPSPAAAWRFLAQNLEGEKEDLSTLLASLLGLAGTQTGPGPVSDSIFGPAVGVPSSAQPLQCQHLRSGETGSFPGS